MAYHGYLNLMTTYADQIFKQQKNLVRILEVGVLNGATLCTLVNNLNFRKIQYRYVGVDVKLEQNVIIFAASCEKTNNSTIRFSNKSSIDYLKSENDIYDIILIDGDHNYPTVSEECQQLYKLTHQNTIIIFDDYSGKFEENDNFYSNQPGWEDISNLATHNPNSKKGVKIAVDEFVDQNNLNSFKLDGEPIIVFRKENNLIKVNRADASSSKKDI